MSHCPFDVSNDTETNLKCKKNLQVIQNKNPPFGRVRLFGLRLDLARVAGVVVDRLEGDGELDGDFLAGNAILEEEPERLALDFGGATVDATGGETGEAVESGADGSGDELVRLRDGSGEGEEDLRKVHGTFVFYIVI